ncbi:UV-stimulated scaffold protein A isoform X2 [Cyprinodon tularosa]|uniref:UV-stimulated scaffold protein A isoform X2 n=1 Tax=Cyprinodon tularosa TaxID=77115 RepID=UPI0018E1F82C|nr:UV-stimulated scaffold protein A isoform X2 [Cyprinodon tularosa]
MELPQRERLSQLVEELTTSGQQQLHQEKMKELKKLCRLSTDCIDHVYHSVMTQLSQEHAEIRLSAFQITGELFSRSHHFRTLLVDNFQEFLELTVETDSEQPLPPPKEVARKLRALAIQTVQSWQTSYGSAYKKLDLGYHFLKRVKKVDFQDAEARTVAERRREEERQRKMERIYRARVEAAAKDMEESYGDMEAALTEMESCMKLLFPEFSLFLPDSSGRSEEEKPCCSRNQNPAGRGGAMMEEKERDAEERREEDEGRKKEGGGGAEEDEGRRKEGGGGAEEDDGRMKEGGGGAEEDEGRRKEGGGGAEESSEEESVDEDSFIRSSGLISHTYSLDVSLSPVVRLKETEDNEPLVSTMMELHRLISSRHLPAVQGWVRVFTKAHAEPQLLRRALSLKKALEAALQKHQDLHIDCKSRVRRVMKATSDGEEDEDDEEEFEEVPEKEGYEPHIPEHLRAEYGLDPSPSTSAAALSQQKAPPRRPPAPPALSSSSSSSSSSRRMKRMMEEEQDPTSAAATLRLLREKLPLHGEPSCSGSDGPGQSGPEQQAAEVPVVPFGLDLYYWGQEQPNAGKIIKSASQHQFWVPAEVEEEVESQELLAQSRSRYISFPGKFVPVSHFCRAPLGNGALCQRQDRLKCPFHGPIVPRDSEGRPCREEDRQREEQRRKEQQPGEETQQNRYLVLFTGTASD